MEMVVDSPGKRRPKDQLDFIWMNIDNIAEEINTNTLVNNEVDPRNGVS